MVVVNDLNVSSWSKPDFSGWYKAGIQFIVKIANILVIILISDLVKGISGVAPPSVEKEGKEEGNDDSGVEAVGIDVKDSVSFKGRCGSP